MRTILACNQLCVYAVCAWFDENNQNKGACHLEVAKLSEADVTNLLLKWYKNVDLSAEAGKGQFLVTRTEALLAVGSLSL